MTTDSADRRLPKLPTRSQVMTLRTAAVIAGDTGVVETCDLALGAFSAQPCEDKAQEEASLWAVLECARLIAEEEASAQVHALAVGMAKRYLGAEAPEDVIAAKVRMYAWAGFAAHTDEERVAHALDIKTVEAWLANRPRFDLAGDDPLGDEA